MWKKITGSDPPVGTVCEVVNNRVGQATRHSDDKTPFGYRGWTDFVNMGAWVSATHWRPLSEQKKGPPIILVLDDDAVELLLLGLGSLIDRAFVAEALSDVRALVLEIESAQAACKNGQTED